MNPDKVLVTVQSHQYAGDFELPADTKLGEYQQTLLESLKKQDRSFASWRGIRLFYAEKEIRKTDSLSEHAVWDGAYIEVKEDTDGVL